MKKNIFKKRAAGLKVSIGSFVLAFSAFIFVPAYAQAATLYWYNSGADSQWTTLTGNWYADAAHTVQAASLPISSTAVITEGTVGPSVNIDTWTQPSSINAVATGITFTSAQGNSYGGYKGYSNVASNANGVTIDVKGNATFNGNSFNGGTVTGNAVFNDTSYNNADIEFLPIGKSPRGTVTGNATFNDTSYNGGDVKGNAVFNDQSLNYGTQYNDYNPSCGGTNLCIGDWPPQLGGVVYGSATFNGSSSNHGTVKGNAIFNDDSSNPNPPIPTKIPQNGYYGEGVSEIMGNAAFNGSSTNNGVVKGTITFGTGATVSTSTPVVATPAPAPTPATTTIIVSTPSTPVPAPAPATTTSVSNPTPTPIPAPTVPKTSLFGSLFGWLSSLFGGSKAPVSTPVTATSTVNPNVVSASVSATTTATTSAPLPDPVAVAPGTWQNDPGIKLCWNGKQGGNCPAGDGTINSNGKGSVVLGAVEYCQYLDANGVTVDPTPQNFWRLPTATELQAGYAANPSGFKHLGTGYGLIYWSITGSGDSAEYFSASSKGVGQIGTFSDVNKAFVRCIQ